MDSLLARYSLANMSLIATKDSDTVDLVNKVSSNKGFRNKGNFTRQDRKRGNVIMGFCAGCFALGKQLNVYIDFKHKATDCPRQSAVVKMLQDDTQDYHTDQDEDS